jgi:hypothetical protein
MSKARQENPRRQLTLAALCGTAGMLFFTFGWNGFAALGHFCAGGQDKRMAPSGRHVLVCTSLYMAPLPFGMGPGWRYG